MVGVDGETAAAHVFPRPAGEDRPPPGGGPFLLCACAAYIDAARQTTWVRIHHAASPPRDTAARVNLGICAAVPKKAKKDMWGGMKTAFLSFLFFLLASKGGLEWYTFPERGGAE